MLLDAMSHVVAGIDVVSYSNTSENIQSPFIVSNWVIVEEDLVKSYFDSDGRSRNAELDPEGANPSPRLIVVKVGEAKRRADGVKESLKRAGKCKAWDWETAEVVEGSGSAIIESS